MSEQQNLNGFPVVRCRVSELKKAPYNPRQISPDKADALRKSIAAFGLPDPVIVNSRTGHIIAGHQRVDQLVELGIEETDVVMMSLSEADEMTLNIALNQSYGDWETSKLKEVLQQIAQSDVNILLTGFDQIQIDSFLQIPDFGPTGEDDQPRLDERSKITCPNCGHEFTA